MLESSNTHGLILGPVLACPGCVAVRVAAETRFFGEIPVGTSLRRLVGRQGFGEAKLRIIRTDLQATLGGWDHAVLPSAPGAGLYPWMSYFGSFSMQSIFAVTHKIKKLKNKRLFWTVKLKLE